MAKNKEIKKVEEKEKRYLIIGLLYFICSLLWIVSGIGKVFVKESYLFDIILGCLLLILAIIYFYRYKKGKK